MAEISVRDFANTVGISVERLITQLSEAGLSNKQAADIISEQEKSQLLTYLRRLHGKDEQTPEPSKITLKRKTVSEIKIPVDKSKGKLRVAKPTVAKTVSVEFRRKRTYVKRSVVAEEEAARIEKESAEQERQRLEQQAALPPTTPLTATEIAPDLPAEAIETVPEITAVAATPVEVVPEEIPAPPVVEIPVVPPRSKPEFVQNRPEGRNEGRGGERDGRGAGGGRKELHVASDKSGKRKKKQPPPRRPGRNMASSGRLRRSCAKFSLRRA
jgi:translation initiation factor IF-2